MKAALIVAHPDDELLFATAKLLQTGYDWDLLVLTQGQLDGRKADKAVAVLRSYGVRIEARSESVHDAGLVWTPAEYKEAREAVFALPGPYDEVYTHNPKGDYGHPHHVALSQIVSERWPDAWRFYINGETGVGPQWLGMESQAATIDTLKLSIFHEAYGRSLFRALAADHPVMIEQLFGTQEIFTR